MKKINKILVLVNVIALMFIILKYYKQVENINYEISDFDISLGETRYELEREILFGEGNYSEFVDGKRINTSEEIKKELTLYDGLKVNNLKIEYQDNVTSINANILNDSEEEKGGYHAYLVFFNEKEEEIFKIKIYINKLLPHSESVFATGVPADISDIYRCEIKKIEGEN